ncbi:unnamed protein product, partial [Linum tenue]
DGLVVLLTLRCQSNLLGSQREILVWFLQIGDVGSSRLGNFLPQTDNVLDEICRLIDDKLRDSMLLS